MKALIGLAEVPRRRAALQPGPFPCLDFAIPWLLAKPGEGDSYHIGCGQLRQLPEKATLGPEPPVPGTLRGPTQGTQSQRWERKENEVWDG